MAYRCPSCNKFCGIEAQDPDCEGSADYGDGKGTVNITATVSFTSQCCGNEVASATIEIEQDFTSADLESS